MTTNRDIVALLDEYGLSAEEKSAILSTPLEEIKACEEWKRPRATVECFRERELSKQIAFLPDYVGLEQRVVSKLSEMVDDAQCPAELLSIAKTMQTLRASGMPLNFGEESKDGGGITVQILNQVS